MIWSPRLDTDDLIAIVDQSGLSWLAVDGARLWWRGGDDDPELDPLLTAVGQARRRVWLIYDGERRDEHRLPRLSPSSLHWAQRQALQRWLWAKVGKDGYASVRYQRADRRWRISVCDDGERLKNLGERMRERGIEVCGVFDLAQWLVAWSQRKQPVDRGRMRLLVWRRGDVITMVAHDATGAQYCRRVTLFESTSDDGTTFDTRSTEPLVAQTVEYLQRQPWLVGTTIDIEQVFDYAMSATEAPGPTNSRLDWAMLFNSGIRPSARLDMRRWRQWHWRTVWHRRAWRRAALATASALVIAVAASQWLAGSQLTWQVQQVEAQVTRLRWQQSALEESESQLPVTAEALLRLAALDESRPRLGWPGLPLRQMVDAVAEAPVLSVNRWVLGWRAQSEESGDAVHRELRVHGEWLRSDSAAQVNRDFRQWVDRAGSALPGWSLAVVQSPLQKGERAQMAGRLQSIASEQPTGGQRFGFEIVWREQSRIDETRERGHAALVRR